MGAIAELLRPGDYPGEQILDKHAFRAFAAAEMEKRTGRTLAQEKSAVDTINRILSGIGGVAELTAIEGDFETLNIYRDSIPLDMCQMRNLPLGTLPLYRTKTINPVGVFQGSLAGGGSTVYYATSQAGVQVYPFTVSTEKVMVPNLNNLYDMEKLMQRKDGLERLDHDLQIVLNNVIINTICGNADSIDVVTDDPAVTIQNYANFGGSFAGKNVYVLDPGVLAAGVPTVNYYDKSAENGLTKAVFQTVNSHAIQIGRRFVKMYISTAPTSGNAPVWESLENLATPVALVTGQGNQNPAKAIPAEMWSKFQRDDFRGSVTIDWFGLQIEVSKQNWLPAGYALVFSDEPCAIMWDRLSLESGQPADGSLTTPVDGFYDYKSKAKQIATARPDFCLRNFLLLKIQS
jgi:hypothetical protein